MDVATHIETLRAEGDRMAAVSRAADPGAPVPTCPDWAVRDLVHHLGGVHRWAARYVAEARTEYSPADLEELAGGWPSDTELAEWFVEGHTALVKALVEAPADLECWTFLPAPSPLAMWARRQAHETAIHRVDTELSAGVAVQPFAPAFAADGVGELLTCFVPRRSAKLRTDEPTSFGVRCTDDPAAWVLTVGPDGVDGVDGVDQGSDGDGGAAAACTLSGPAGALYLALWNRGGADGLEVAGDLSLLELFGAGMQLRWS